jgi:ankyrin repeat protein
MSDLLISGLAGLAAFMIALSSVKKSNEKETVGGGIKEDEELINASIYGNLAVVNALLANKANVNHQDAMYGDTALMLASRNDHLAVVKTLLAARANVNLQNKYGETALMLASRNDHLAVVKTLLAARANVNLQNKNGSTALMSASINDRLAVVNVLLESGANVNLQNKYGETALMWASRNGHLAVVKALLAAKANVDLQDKNGSTALMSASLNDRLAVVKLLIEYARDQLQLKIKERLVKMPLTNPMFRKLPPNLIQFQILESFWREGCLKGAKSEHLTLLAFAAHLGLIDVDKLQLPLNGPQELCRNIGNRIDEIKDPR